MSVFAAQDSEAENSLGNLAVVRRKAVAVYHIIKDLKKKKEIKKICLL